MCAGRSMEINRNGPTGSCCGGTRGPQCQDCPMKYYDIPLQNLNIQWNNGWVRNGITYPTWEQAANGSNQA